jgi:hypothetical protein
LEASLDQLGILLQSSSAPFSSNLLRHNPFTGILGLTLYGTQNASEMFPCFEGNWWITYP